MNWTGAAVVGLCTASLPASSGGVKGVPSVGGVDAAGSRPEARSCAIRGFSAGGGARPVGLICGVVIGG